MPHDNECEQTAAIDKLENKVDKFTFFSGQMSADVKTIKDDVQALFDKSKEVLDALNKLTLKTSVETTKLQVKYGFIGVLIGSIPASIVALLMYFKKP